MLHVKLFFYSSCIALSFHTTRKNCSTLIHSFGRGLILYLYIHTFLSRIPSIILHAFLIPNFKKIPFDHSFLSGGSDFSVFFNSFVCHCSLLYQSMLMGESGCCMSILLFSSCIALLFHAARKKCHSTSQFLTEGVDFSVFFNGFPYHFSLLYQPMLLGEGGCCVSNFSFIVLHCSVIPYY